MVQISADATAADRLETALDDTAGSVPWFGIVDQGTAQAVTASTIRLRSAAAFADDELNGLMVYIQSATTGAGQVRRIIDYSSATDAATIEPDWTTTPTGTILYKVFANVDGAGSVQRTNLGLASANLDTQLAALPTDAEIADAVWDEAIAGHATAGSTGAALSAAGSAGDPWTTALPGAYSAGTAGFILGTNLDAAITTRMATYTQPTGFLAATFPTGTIANTTNITAGTITTATNVTTVNGLANNVITSSVIATNALNNSAFTTGYFNAINAEVDTAISDAALATATNLATVDNVVDAIKAKTDNLTFTVTGQVDANAESMNGAEILGNGTAGDLWRGS
jgi:hypothetical protein